MSQSPTRVAIIGCGNIAGRYAERIAAYPELELAGATDLDPARAEALTKEHGGRAYATLEELLADETIPVVVNLTIHHVHHAITKQCLQAGKHVHSEKPLALTPADAQDLVATATANGVRLGSSPFTWMGEAQQTAWKQIREGKIGTVRAVYAEVNHGRIEAWHPNPGPFYDVGPWFDVGVYPLTMLTTFFGPAQWIQAHGQVLYPDRTTKEGVDFHIDTPDFLLATIGLADGPIVRLTCNFYVHRNNSRQAGIEFHGDVGSLYLGSWQGFDAEVAMSDFGVPLAPVELLRPGHVGTDWGRAIRDLALAIRDDRPHRATGAQAAHVVDVLAAAIDSSKADGCRVVVTSTFPAPAPMPWGE
jgi:predicted dehydrogenase